MNVAKTRMIIQIYEIQTPHEARMMADIGVDHVGSVLVSDRDWKNPVIKSTIEQAKESGCKSSLIPLFRSIDMIADAVDFYRPGILHFCESLQTAHDAREALCETLNRQVAIRERFPDLEIMRSIPIAGGGRGDMVSTMELAAMFEPFSDWFLTDTVVGEGDLPLEAEQPVKGYIGITGKTCDWDVARELVVRSRIPVILAGGIGPDNVAEAIARVKPAGVDSCTLTNSVDPQGKAIRFKKDPEKVKAMIASARNAVLQ